MYYQLYFEKDKCIIKVKAMDRSIQRADIINKLNSLDENDVWDYNIYYKFSRNKKVLKQVAEEMKAEWIKELADRMKQIEEIKI